MIQVLLFLAVAAALFLSIYLMARSSSSAEGGAQALLEARQALSSLRNGLLPTGLIERIFSRDDFEFVRATATKPVQLLFVAERKKIARSWVAQLRNQIVSLRQFHSGSSRHYAQLSFATELRLLLDFQKLLWMCRALDVALLISGPYAAPKMVASSAAVASRICTISEKSIAFLTAPAGQGALRDNSSGKAVI